MYQTLYNSANENDADISMCNFYQVYNSKYTPFSNENNENMGIKVLQGIHKTTHNIRISNNFVWNKLYRRHLFNELRFPRGRVYEDIFTMYRLIDDADRMVISSECKYYYLRRRNSISLNNFKLNQLDNVEAYIEIYEYVSNKYPALEKTCRKQIYLSLLWVLGEAYKDNAIEINRNAIENLAVYLQIMNIY